MELSSSKEKSLEEVLKESLKQVSSANPSNTTGSDASGEDSISLSGDKLDFKVIYNKKKFDVSLGSDNTVGELKSMLQSLIQIPPSMMKVMIKGLAKDDMTLKRIGVSKGSKVMVIGSSLDDVMAVSKSSSSSTSTTKPGEDGNDSSSNGEENSFSKAKMHIKILDKGIPEDVMAGIKGLKEPLPSVPLSGMLNKYGGKVRLTFKNELDQLWIGTRERTEKLPMNSIKNVISEAIEGHEEYHILALQLGSTDASRYWIYWVPAQYVDAIKDSILGKWQFY